jgi:hypothetical protein
MIRLTVLGISVFTLFLFSSCAKEENKVSTEEMKLFITPKDFNDKYDYEYPLSREYEKVTKSKWLGDTEYTYEYSTPDSLENVLYLSLNVDFLGKSSDAIVSYNAYKLGGNIGISTTDAELVEMDSLFSYGDQSSLKQIRIDGKPLGNIFVVRIDKMVYHFVISGLYIDDPSIWKELMEEKLKAVGRYKPA